MVKGLNIRDWLYVEDHAKAIDLIYRKGTDGETYNIGGNNERQNIDIVKTLCRIMDVKLGRPEGESEKLSPMLPTVPGTISDMPLTPPNCRDPWLEAGGKI
jgi:dTDP-D-glucose 4,6-dehydratase